MYIMYCIYFIVILFLFFYLFLRNFNHDNIIKDGLTRKIAFRPLLIEKLKNFKTRLSRCRCRRGSWHPDVSQINFAGRQCLEGGKGVISIKLDVLVSNCLIRFPRPLVGVHIPNEEKK